MKQIVIRIANRTANMNTERGASLLEHLHGYTVDDTVVMLVGRSEDETISDIQNIIAAHGIEAIVEVMEPGDSI